MRISEPIRRVPWPVIDPGDPEARVTREWIFTNGLGGYASGTVSGVITRRYHGLLIASLPDPFGRIVMLSHLAEQVRFGDGRRVEMGGREPSGDNPDAHGTDYLTEFRLEMGIPVWCYDVEGFVVEKRVFLPYMQNTVFILYDLLAGQWAQLQEALRSGADQRLVKGVAVVPELRIPELRLLVPELAGLAVESVDLRHGRLASCSPDSR